MRRSQMPGPSSYNTIDNLGEKGVSSKIKNIGYHFPSARRFSTSNILVLLRQKINRWPRSIWWSNNNSWWRLYFIKYEKFRKKNNFQRKTNNYFWPEIHYSRTWGIWCCWRFWISCFETNYWPLEYSRFKGQKATNCKKLILIFSYWLLFVNKKESKMNNIIK